MDDAVCGDSDCHWFCGVLCGGDGMEGILAVSDQLTAISC